MPYIVLFVLAISSVAQAANPPLREVLPKARSGEAGAQYVAGMMYLMGQGTTQDIAEATRWLQRSVTGGLPQAMVALAALYDVGQGVPFDPNRATQLRQQAAKLGNPTAQGQLRWDATKRDQMRADALTDMRLYAPAVPYARRAADAGSAEAQCLLGRAYEFGHGVQVDRVAAVKLYEKCDARGLADGSKAMGHVYEFGIGVARNRQKALVYYDRAAARGSVIAKRMAANLRSPDYDASSYGGGTGSGSQSNDFRQFQCIGAGGAWNGSYCSANNGNGPIIQ